MVPRGPSAFPFLDRPAATTARALLAKLPIGILPFDNVRMFQPRPLSSYSRLSDRINPIRPWDSSQVNISCFSISHVRRVFGRALEFEHKSPTHGPYSVSSAIGLPICPFIRFAPMGAHPRHLAPLKCGMYSAIKKCLT